MKTKRFHQTVVTGLLAVACVARLAQSQSTVPYARTEFLSGFNGSATDWALAAYLHNQSLNLGTTYRIRDISTSQSIETQRNQLLATPEWGAVNEKAVLVGHSMGGLVARAIAQARPNQVFGIVTVATPISGARIAGQQQLGQVRARILDCLNRIDALNFGNRWPFGDVRGMIAQAVQLFDGLMPANAPAINDLRQNSVAVQDINFGTGPNIPVAQVLGRVPPNDIHLRLLASSHYTSLTFPQMVAKQNTYLIWARVLKYFGYASLNGMVYARKLGYAINTYEKLDRTIFAQATGGNLLLQFDGIVAADDAAWKGWGDVRQVFISQGDDHLSVLSSAGGVAQQNLALRSVGVQSY